MNGKKKQDLFILTADADAKAVMEAVLQRHQSLGIRPITFQVERHPARDSGIAKDGPEFARQFRREFRYAILLWDHAGSGWEHRIGPAQGESSIGARLAGVSWKSRSLAVAVVPELEAWLWPNRASLRRHWNVTNRELDGLIKEFEKERGVRAGTAVSSQPKELFEFIQVQKLLRTISPRDFADIANRASLRDWRSCDSFNTIVQVLNKWFPGE